jgi:hypothetical protein
MGCARRLQNSPENPVLRVLTYDPGGCACIGVNTLVDQVLSVVGPKTRANPGIALSASSTCSHSWSAGCNLCCSGEPQFMAPQPITDDRSAATRSASLLGGRSRGVMRFPECRLRVRDRRSTPLARSNGSLPLYPQLHGSSRHRGFDFHWIRARLLPKIKASRFLVNSFFLALYVW